MEKTKFVTFLILLTFLLEDCSPPASETTAPTTTQNIDKPTLSSSPTDKPVTEIIPITGPSMKVGVTYPYIDGSTLVAVPAGEFIMGANGQDNPEHEVTLGDFWIYSTKVTNQQYALCSNSDQCTPPDQKTNPTYKDKAYANYPIVGITYDQASIYCHFVQGRLPTEAEWEKAARGPNGNLYPWGNNAPSCDLLNYNNCVGRITDVVNYPEGGSYYGALDMAGNVFEWVADWYDPNYYEGSPTKNPAGPIDGTRRVVRSSTYASSADMVTVTLRYPNTPDNKRTDLGFRCVVEDPAYFAPFCEAAPIYDTTSSGASQASESCPNLDIKQSSYCMDKLPRTNVTFSGPTDATIDANGCISTDNPNLFSCQTSGTVVSIAANCQLVLPGNPLCPSGYSQEGDTCLTNGGEGQCLAGWSFDSSRRCCEPQGGTKSTSGLQVCPVGTFSVENPKLCAAYPIQGIVAVTQEVKFISCSKPGGSRGGSVCQPRECGLSLTWDPNLCCCTVDGISCS